MTGGTSGIGRGLVQRLANSKGGGTPSLIVATARDPSSPASLSLLDECKKNNGNGGGSSAGNGGGGSSAGAGTSATADVRVMRLDVTDEASVAAWADELAAVVPHVDVAVLSAGVYGSRGGFLDLTAADFDLAFKTNSTGPFLVVQALARRGLLGGRGAAAAEGSRPRPRPFARELLLGAAAAAAAGSQGPGALPPLRAEDQGGVTSLVALVSSVLASHGDPAVSAVSPGGHAYRASKAALNMIGHALCVGLAPEGVATTTLHPGYVRGTGMTGDQGWLSVDESVDGLEALLTGGGGGGATGVGAGEGAAGVGARPLHGRWWHAGTLEEIPW